MRSRTAVRHFQPRHAQLSSPLPLLTRHSADFLPHGTEITTFEHACGEPPCAITQLHCPTAGPTGWQDAIVRIYVDGETTPSVNISLLEMANVGNFAAGNGMGPGDTATPSPWGVGLFGHTAKNGGVYSTMRIPFGTWESINSMLALDCLP